MIKKNKIKNVAALILGLTFAVAGAGCEFLTTNNDKDMAQTIGEVNIASYLAGTKDFADYSDDMVNVINNGGMTTKILKRDLVSAFMNVGSTYVQQYGYSYRQTFELLMDSLVNRKIMAQYAMAYYLKNDETKTAAGCIEFVETKTNSATGKIKENFENHPEVLAIQYFLDEEDYNTAVYSLKKAINNSLDSTEQSFITADEEEHNHGEARTLPSKVDTEKTDYYPKDDNGNIDYEIFTGREPVGTLFGEYEKVEGSTQTTRLKAYNSFLANLSANNLILKGENTAKFVELDYYYVELGSQLEQALINKLGEDLTTAAENELTIDFVKEQYELDVEAQKTAYNKDFSSFGTALDSVSDTSFVLNAPVEDYGFVYNILIPFDAWQTESYSAEKAKGYTNSELYKKRADILQGVQAKDLRDSWFSEHDHANYAYEVDGKYYFFENQTEKSESKNLDRYESLGQYAGNYAYNGTVTLNADDKFEKATPNKMGIDAFIAEFEGYIASQTGLTVTGSKYANYKTDGNYSLNEKNEFSDYSEFMYYTGKVEGLNFNPVEFFVEGTNAYKALSAVNELMFAYSTDTGCLNTYMGYVVSPFTTSFVKEFEYAAQYAIRELGVGGYTVCPSDYGWHIIYVSNKLDTNVYGLKEAITQELLDTEGSFFNLYYESLKSASAQSYQTMIENNVLVEYNNGDCVTLFTDRYEDLLSIGE
ncbi:MAG: hypothetical protein E7343_06030 [Clostridiales bacterium]|nr:hypothetical protein [Clostridiales bacterium]